MDEEHPLRQTSEIQQLLLLFEEMWTKKKYLTTAPASSGPRERPLIQYFQRCVSKVVIAQKNFVAQDKVLRFVLSWTTGKPQPDGVRNMSKGGTRSFGAAPHTTRTSTQERESQDAYKAEVLRTSLQKCEYWGVMKNPRKAPILPAARDAPRTFKCAQGRVIAMARAYDDPENDTDSPMKFTRRDRHRKRFAGVCQSTSRKHKATPLHTSLKRNYDDENEEAVTAASNAPWVPNVSVDAVPNVTTPRLATLEYLSKCKQLNMAPVCPTFLRNPSQNDWDLSANNLNDKKVEALSSAMVHVAPYCVDEVSLNLSRNLLTGTSLSMFDAKSALSKHTSELAASITSLDLSYNPLTRHALQLLAKLLDGKSLMLTRLLLNGVCIRNTELAPLVKAICFTRIRTVGLEDTQLSRWHDNSGDIVRPLFKTVHNLYLGYNFWREASLDVAFPAMLSEKGCVVEYLSLASTAGERGDRFMRTIEALRQAETLYHVDLSYCHLNARDMVVLEASGLHLRSLNVAGNAFGQCGLRSLVRLFVQQPELQKVTVNDMRDEVEPIGSDEPTYRYGDLVKDYQGLRTLCLTEPYHRSILLLLLHRCSELKMDPEKAFRNFSYADHSHSGRANFKKDASGMWQVPRRDSCSFDLFLEIPNSRTHQSPADLVHAWQVARRLPIGLLKFAVMVTILNSMSQKDQIAFISACTKDLLFKPSQMQYLVSDVAVAFPHFIPEMMTDCMLSVKVEDRALSMFLSANKALKVRPMKPHVIRKTLTNIKELLHFNINNPTGRYVIDLEDPCDFSIAQKILMIRTWESSVAMAKQLLDTTQHGEYNGIRNATFDGCPMNIDACWMIPGDGFSGQGILKFDYATPLSRPKRQHVDIPSDDKFNTFLSHVLGENSDAMPGSRMCAFRGVSHLIYFTPARVIKVLEGLPDFAVNIFIFLAPRTVDFGPLVVNVDTGVLSPTRSFWKPGHLSEIRERLGLCNTFDILDIHRPNVATNVFDLALWDEHKAAEAVLLLADYEPGENLRDPEWSGLDSDIGSAKWSVPASWLHKLPHSGTFKVTYTVEMDSSICIKKDKRIELGQTYFGWVVTA